MNTSTLSAPVKSTTERQLELTLNSLARSMRKAIRLAEKDDPTGTSGLWKVVEHRAGLLETMMKAAADYARRLAAPQEKLPAAEEGWEKPVVPKVAATSAPKKAKTERTKAEPAPAAQPTAKQPAHQYVQQQGKGWRLAA